jgi:NAD(P)-dependent dehydrogenase (short-subunit alcohol dehydrogenase family)
MSEFGRLDIVVNNAAIQFPTENLEDISEDQLDTTFRTNIYAQFFLSKAALKYLKEGSSIINTSSINALGDIKC